MDQVILTDTKVDEALTYVILYEIIPMGTPSRYKLYSGLYMGNENGPPFTGEESEGQREETAC